MRNLTRGWLLAVLVVVVVSVAGAACGSGDGIGDGANGEDTSQQDGGTSEGGEDSDDDGRGGGGPGAVVSPLKIPAIQQKGAPIGDVRDSITAEFVEACGGELCVDLAEVDANGDTVTDECVFSRTDPGEGTEVDRDSTVTLVVVCGGQGSGDDDEEDDTTTTEASGDGA